MTSSFGFGVPIKDVDSSSFYNPNFLAGLNKNYSSFLPSPATTQSPYGFLGFDLSSIPKEDRGLAMFAAMSDPTRQTRAMVDAFKQLDPLLLEQAREKQKLGIQSNLWGAAIKSIADLPKTIAQSAAQAREGRLAGQQAILNQQQRPYNIGGFSMPYNSYRV